MLQLKPSSLVLELAHQYDPIIFSSDKELTLKFPINIIFAINANKIGFRYMVKGDRKTVCCQPGLPGRSLANQVEARLAGSFSVSGRSSASRDLLAIDDVARYTDEAGVVKMARVEKKENILEKSIGRLKETGTDVWQGTQLLAIDVAAATGLVRRALIGDELTEKEKKTLKRTLTDMASVTAVGHAAMLAAIQRYVPALIPSTYAPERLDLLRQLEKVKQMAVDDISSDEEVDEDK
ncbi:hypothetical protein V8G54_031211 [Vigna mungo]|uniref:Uncharacterized protein n=1 Tax=Vigna mungo TaxID=3915 RepID=A0AAQ3MYK9_VIGMU